MTRLDHWDAAELRLLAEKFRSQAARTKMTKYIELLHHTADELEQQAEARDGAHERPGGHIDLLV
ncbi:MAG TPA: hypothetical protein VMU08_16945 [Rhizomicrobium sp.]|nr:hypothetical protein [Rhizomicrobium sp.]